MELPDFSFEKKAWKRGFKTVAGVDEVGRGCFAGPVVAGCAVFNKRMSSAALKSKYANNQIIINDSKRLSPKQREIADKWIRENALAVGIGQASVAQINKFGTKKASEIAFRLAIKVASKNLEDREAKRDNEVRKMKSEARKLKIHNSKFIFPIQTSNFSHQTSIDYLLIDAFYIPYVKGLRRRNQKAIVKGDTKSISIAAASIIAKVYRDSLMTKLSNNSKFRIYKWGKNKGYGTKEHQKAIKKHGMTKLHRKAFVNTWSSKLEARNPKS
ncbi:MAG: ribonuclease HII [Candidatus Woesebacteria bacterium]|nr:MAG: ribonuclease HII [Candidatus Woesebacteria bacterium]